MIEKFEGMYILVCDMCGEEHPETFFEFYDAVQAKKDNGWKSKVVDGDWADSCEECCRRGE